MLSKSRGSQIISNEDEDFETNYCKWTNEIETIASETIGKTTFNPNRKHRESKEIREMRSEKRTAKKRI